MTECNAIIEANNKINKLKRENKKLNELCVQYGFEMGKLEEENEQLKQQLSEQGTQIDFLKDENQHMRDLVNENKQLKHDATVLIQSNQDYRRENEQLKKEMGDLGTAHAKEITKIEDAFDKEILQLKKDNNALIKIIENQSYIINQLHTKLIEYRLKEPIKLTSEDIELMGKAISYYTHGRYAE